MEHADSGLDIVANPVDSGASRSPISQLDQDVMWRIFSMNANMNNDDEFRIYSNDKLKNKNNRALYTTWHSSQVCRFWRRPLLNAPTLWAQLIDLDGLSSVDDLMKEEIVRRSGLCPLAIAGHVFAIFPKEKDFFISIIRNNWARIRSLKVSISQSNKIPGDVWDVLSEPAQTLEHFRIRASNGLNPSNNNGIISNVFANYSPFLKSFRSWKINFNFGSGDDEADEPPTQSTIILATKVLSRYSQSFFENNPVTTFQYAITHTTITIAEYRSKTPMYRIFVGCGDPGQLPLLFTLFEAYSSCDFSHVETLLFDIDIFPSQTINADVLKILFKFNSVKSLLFSKPGTIPALYSLVREYTDTTRSSEAIQFSLFPSLTAIKAIGAYNFVSQTKKVSPALLLLQETLAKFVIWRRDYGIEVPVEVIDISDLGDAAKVEIFNSISGIKVICKASPDEAEGAKNEL
ncbi:hypothetical protein JR316_0005621 [Psilocybe cubensis]|uniref:Uncharacterized protein n=2 Tax=Psilocybe cubensis TaxID=181762 RepID=A0ACB8GZQ3_PSICU|nr:hypothetical protein JR316_0005621 [Psilocybe cubensis]KAH9481101.1 hypothetical protein JR316_0005621 [Psilocybe cubensis]